MSKMSEQARSDAKAKAERYVRTDPKAKVDASGYSPPGPMNANVQTGMRVLSRRAFRSGGKVHGEAHMHMGRKARKSGGMTANDYLNRNVKTANEAREGTKHVGALKTGGRVGKMVGGPMLAMRPGLQRPGMTSAAPRAMPMMRASGGKVHDDAAEDKKLIKSEMHKAGCGCAKCHGGKVAKAKGGTVNENDGTRPTGGRMPRKAGGRTKKGTNINIIIAPQGGGAKPPMPMPPPGAAPGPVGMHQGAPPPMAPPGAAPPMGPAPMMRKSGGRAYPIKDGAGGGEGRLQKARAYGP